MPAWHNPWSPHQSSSYTHSQWHILSMYTRLMNFFLCLSCVNTCLSPHPFQFPCLLLHSFRPVNVLVLHYHLSHPHYGLHCILAYFVYQQTNRSDTRLCPTAVAHSLSYRQSPEHWHSQTAESLQSAAAEVAVAQLWWHRLLLISFVELVSGCTATLTQTSLYIHVRISLLRFLLLVVSLVLHVG